MRRQLVLTNESARHRFRQSLPRPVADDVPYLRPLSDRGLFALTFVAAFLAFSVFLG